MHIYGMEPNKTIWPVVTIIVLLLLSFYGGHVAGRTGALTRDTITITTVETKRDTVTIETATPTKVVYLRDTIIETQPFTATIDTVIVNDTIQAEFTFNPAVSLRAPMYWDIRLRPATDTINLSTIQIVENLEQSTPFWETALWVSGGLVAGYVIGTTTKSGTVIVK